MAGRDLQRKYLHINFYFNQLHKMSFLYGGIACMVAAFVTHPIDSIKVRLQLQGELIKSNTPTKYLGLFRGIQTIINEEGIRGLYRGLNASLLREATFI
jgi:hypothetical protein